MEGIMVSIENEFLLAEIGLKGGLLRRVYNKKNHSEIIYDAKGIWPFSDHILFPTIGANNVYSLDDVNYALPYRHGFAWYSDFEILDRSEDSITIGIERKTGEESQYPFPFKMKLTYSLMGLSLVRRSEIINDGGNELVFQFGLHPAFNIDFKKASLEIGEGTRLFVLNKQGIIDQEIPWPHPLTWPIVREDIADKDTLVLDNPTGKIVFNNGLGDRVELVTSCPYFALWTPREIHQDDFLCVESWYGISSYVGMSMDLSKRKGVNIVKSAVTFVDTYNFS